MNGSNFLPQGNELLEGESECAVLLEVQDVGAWIIKIRKNGIIVNNKQLIFSDCIVTSAQIVFTSTNVFWSVMNGGSDFHDEMTKNVVSSSGSDRAIETCLRKLVRSYKQIPLSPATDRNSFRFRYAICLYNIYMVRSSKYNLCVLCIDSVW